MNIAFPLPWSNMTSILRMEAAPGGLALTTLPRTDGHGDEGVYLVTRFLPIRLPFNETITVWHEEAPANVPAGAEQGCVLARHDMWCCGLRFLTLDYELILEPAPTTATSS